MTRHYTVSTIFTHHGACGARIGAEDGAYFRAFIQPSTTNMLLVTCVDCQRAIAEIALDFNLRRRRREINNAAHPLVLCDEHGRVVR